MGRFVAPHGESDCVGDWAHKLGDFVTQ